MNKTTNYELAEIIATVLDVLETRNKEAQAVSSSPTPKAKAKATSPKSKDSRFTPYTRREQSIIDRAIKRLEAAGFEVYTDSRGKEGNWGWIYARDKAIGRSVDFASVELPKGWVYRVKRGGFSREFSV